MCDNDDVTRNASPAKNLGFASPGAVRQHGKNLPVRECKRCGEQIVWVTSQRTGRAYPVNVRRASGAYEWRYYRGDDLHPRDCAEKKAAVAAEFAAAEGAESVARAYVNETNAAAKAARLAAEAATTDEERAAIRTAFLSQLDEIDARYPDLPDR